MPQTLRLRGKEDNDNACVVWLEEGFIVPRVDENSPGRRGLVHGSQEQPEPLLTCTSFGERTRQLPIVDASGSPFVLPPHSSLPPPERHSLLPPLSPTQPPCLPPSLQCPEGRLVCHLPIPPLRPRVSAHRRETSLNSVPSYGPPPPFPLPPGSPPPSWPCLDALAPLVLTESCPRPGTASVSTLTETPTGSRDWHCKVQPSTLTCRACHF